jgi:hypothetical protein
MYYLQAIASLIGGKLNISLNAKMYNSSLNTNTSSMVKTEVQKITVASTIIKETTVYLFIKKNDFILFITLNLGNFIRWFRSLKYIITSS